jgi:putative flippase GtrA
MAGPLDASATAWPEIGLQSGRFVVVGIAATLTHLLVAVLLIDGLGLPSAAAANALGVIAGSSVSYAGNYFWTFRRGGSHLMRLPKFIVSYMTVFVLSSLAMLLIADLGGIAYLLPLIGVVTVTPVVTFLLNRYWVFA